MTMEDMIKAGLLPSAPPRQRHHTFLSTMSRPQPKLILVKEVEASTVDVFFTRFHTVRTRRGRHGGHVTVQDRPTNKLFRALETELRMTNSAASFWYTTGVWIRTADQSGPEH